MKPVANSLVTVCNDPERAVYVTPSTVLPGVIWLDVVSLKGSFLCATLTPEQARKIARDLLAVAP